MREEALNSAVCLQLVKTPAAARIVYADGSTERVKIPVEVWQRGGKWNLRTRSTQLIRSVTADPDHVLPDVQSGNNVWKG